MMPPDDGQRVLWLAVRQGMLLIVRAIEARYDPQRVPRECATLRADRAPVQAQGE
jgi:hypothetical protein